MFSLPFSRRLAPVVIGISIAMGVILFEGALLLSYGSERNNPDSSKRLELSAGLIWRVGGKVVKGQIFVKGDRYRIELQGGIKTSLGNANVTIIRGDKQQVWYVLSPRRLVLAVPMTDESWLPVTVQTSW